MFNLDIITNENDKDHNKKWPYIPDHPYKMLIIGGSGSAKTNWNNLTNKTTEIIIKNGPISQIFHTAC